MNIYKIFAGKCDNETTECITGKCIEKRHDTRNHRLALQQSHNFPIGRPYQGLNNVSKTFNSKKSDSYRLFKPDPKKTRDDEKMTSFSKSWYTAFSFS